ncbi:MAG: hypothetical protein RLZZ292_1596 [Bacteroidota bacterium]|jgi:hypothetical protein
MTYSLIEVFGEMVKEYLAPFLKSKGFKKQNLYFYKEENGLTFLIHFQKNAYNSADYVAFFINCGIYCADFEALVGEEILPKPKEYNCLFNQRFENITGFGKKEFELLESSDEGKKQLAENVIAELEKVIAFYQNIKNVDDLVDLSIEHGSYFYEKVFQYLCLKNDTERLDAYFQSFGEAFKDDERYLFFQHRLNTILIENGIAPMQFKAEMSVPMEMQRPIN